MTEPDTQLTEKIFVFIAAARRMLDLCEHEAVNGDTGRALAVAEELFKSLMLGFIDAHLKQRATDVEVAAN